MLTRRKNRIKKNGKKRYMSRKMRGAGNLFRSYETQFKGKYKLVIDKRDELIRNIVKLNINIEFIHNNIEKAIKTITDVKLKNLISNEFDANVKKFLEELHKYYKQILETGNASVSSAIGTILSVSAFGTIASAVTTPTEKTAFASAIGTILSVSAIGTIASAATTPPKTATKIEEDANKAEEKQYNEIIGEEMTKIENALKDIIPDVTNDLKKILKISTNNKNLLKSLFNESEKNINKVFDTKKEKYDKVQTNETHYKDNISEILDNVTFTFTEKLINYYNDIYTKINNVKTADLKRQIDIINKSSNNNSPVINTPVIEVTKDDYTAININEEETQRNIAYIFHRKEDLELLRSFYEELKNKNVVNQIENKKNEILPKIYTEYVYDLLTKQDSDINKVIKGLVQQNDTQNKNQKTNDKTDIKSGGADTNKGLATLIDDNNNKIEEINNIEKEKKEIITKIISSKIEEEYNKAEYQDITRENAKKILHVRDEKNSKEIKYKYQLTYKMWYEILNNVTDKDRKLLIKQIISKVNASYDVLYQDKETTIDINFYKSIFGKNPFLYRELINVTRTGESVTPIIYGVEELFKLYEDELKFIKDNKSKDAVKPPLKQKKIEVTHKRKNREFPIIFDSFT